MCVYTKPTFDMALCLVRLITSKELESFYQQLKGWDCEFFEDIIIHHGIPINEPSVENRGNQTWVVKLNDEIIGTACIVAEEKSTVLSYLWLRFEYRCLGIGKWIIYKLKSMNKPIDIFLNSDILGLMKFYMPLGFLPVDDTLKEIYKNMKQHLSKFDQFSWQTWNKQYNMYQMRLDFPTDK